MTLADLGRKSVRRNALIADLLHRIAFIDKAGTGMKRIRTLKTGLPDHAAGDRNVETTMHGGEWRHVTEKKGQP